MSEYDDLLATGKPPVANEYDEILQQESQVQKTQLRSSLYEALDTQPDSYAKAHQLGGKLGLPAPVVARNLPQVERNAKLNDYDTLLTEHPALAEQMRDPEFAKLAHDDLDNLGPFEKALGVTGRALRNSSGSLLSGLVPRTNAALWGVAQAGADTLSTLVTGPLTEAGILPQDVGGVMSEEFQAYRKLQSGYADALEGDQSAIGPNERAVYGGFRSMGQNLSGLAASVVSGSPAPILALMGAETAGDAYGQARDKGVPVGGALTFGLSQGGIEVATEKIPALWLLRDLGRTGFGKLLVNQLAAEIPGEQVATILQDLNEWAVLNPGAPISQYMAERPGAAVQTLISTVVATGGQVTLAKAMERALPEQDRALQADAFKNRIDELAQLAQASKLRERAPDKFEAAVRGMLGENADADLYVNAQQFVEYFQSAGIDPREVIGQLTGVQAQLAEALVTGGDLRIPAAEYITKLAPTEYHQGLGEILRTEPQGMSAREAADWQTNQAEEFQRTADQILAERAGDMVFQESADQVQRAIREQIVATGRFTEDTADKYAALHRAFAVTMGERLGLAPADVYERYGLAVRGAPVAGTGAGGQQFDQQAGSGNIDPMSSVTEPAAVERGLRGRGVDDETVANVMPTVGELLDNGARIDGQGMVTVYHRTTKDAAREIRTTGTMRANEDGVFFSTLPKGQATGYGDELLTLRVPVELLQLDDAFGNEAHVRIPLDASRKADVSNFLTDTQPLKPESEAPDWAALEQADVETQWNAFYDWAKSRNWKVKISGASNSTSSVYLDIDKPTEIDPEYGVVESVTARIRFADHSNSRGKDDSYELNLNVAPGALSIGEAAADIEAFMADAVSPNPSQRSQGAGEFNQSVFHGSPHRFDKFTLDHIGSGEGAQAYGWGLYFAGKKEVAEFYREKLGAFAFTYDGQPVADEGPQRAAVELLWSWQGDKAGALDDASGYDNPRAIKAEIKKLDFEKIARGGQLYEVNIPDDGEYLLWDKPLSEQPEKVRKAIYDSMNPNGNAVNVDGQWVQLDNSTAGRRVAQRIENGTATGSEIYSSLFGGYRNQQSASKYLNSLGIQGIKYLDGSSRSEGEGSYNYVIFDASAIEILNTYYQQARGRIQFPADLSQSPSIITLLEGADLSTFLHESGHFFYEVMRHIAAQPDAPAEVVKDLETLHAWFKETSPQWDGVVGVEQHEQFARGFESYLFEGKAPSLELRGLFDRFRAWMVAVYRNLKALNVTLTDDVRGVFDRLLASEARIKEVEIARQYTPLFESAEQAGMTTDAWAEYQALGKEATGEAVDDLQRRSLRDMRWLSNAKSRELKRLQREAKSKREAMRAEAETQVYRQPVYAARRFLTHGELNIELDGSRQKRLATELGLTTGKLSIPELRKMYGDAPAARWRYFATGRYGMVAEEGVHPDVVAELFGFGSGDALVQALLDAEHPDTLIEATTDRLMLERYGELVDADALERAAESAVHNEARLRFVATELTALDRAVNPRADTGRTDRNGRRISYAVLPEAAKAYAAEAIARKKVRDAVRTAQYSAAETRAARAADKALRAGKTDEAATHKRAQLLNTYFYRAATQAADEVDKTLRYLRKFANEGTRKALDPDYRDQIDALLERFDLKRGVSQKDLAKRASLKAWVEAQQAQGYEPLIDDRLLEAAAKRHYSEIPLEELRGLRDTVKNIEHLARLKQRLLTQRDERLFEQAVDEAVTTIAANSKGPRKIDIETHLPADDAARLVAGYFASHRKLASLLRQMDGFQDGGVLWELLMRPLNERSDQEAVLREEATIALNDLFAPLVAQGDLYRKEHIPEIGRSLTRMGRLVVALNLGNDGNRQRLMGGYNWTPAQLDAIVAPLTQADWDFVQGVWDLVGSYWPQIAAKEKRVTGLEPGRVEAKPVNTPFGQLRGGYFPIKYDDRQSPRAYADAAKEAADQALRGNYSRATTRRGHTKARVEAVNRPVRLDFGVMFEHIEQVVHDVSLHEYLIDANRLLGNKRMQDAIITHYGPEVYKMLQSAITDVAAGDVPATKAIERAVNWIRTGTSIAFMGWSVTTAMLQPLGLTQSMVRVGPKWVGRGLSRWLRDAVSMESTPAWIYERSDLMRLRGKTMQREISEIRNRVAKQGRLPAVQESFFWLIGRMQMVADIPTWLGAYEKAMAQGSDEARAVALADQAVLDSQGGGQIKDLADIQRGGPLLKLWTNFYSYFNVLYNLNVESLRRTNFKSPTDIGRLAVDLLLLNTVPSVLATLMYEALRNNCDGDWDCIAARAGRDQLSYLLGAFVGARELSAAVSGYSGYEGPAGARLFAEVGKLGKQVEQGEVDEGLLKALNKTAGILLHYPAAQVERTAQGFEALTEGETRNPLVLLTGPPKD